MQVPWALKIPVSCIQTLLGALGILISEMKKQSGLFQIKRWKSKLSRRCTRARTRVHVLKRVCEHAPTYVTENARIDFR